MTSDWSPPGRPGDEEREEPELSLEELESEAAGSLPDRQAMSVIDASVTIPANPALAADVLADTLEEASAEPDPGGESVDGEASEPFLASPPAPGAALARSFRFATHWPAAGDGAIVWEVEGGPVLGARPP